MTNDLAIEFIKHHHDGQYRAHKTPTWHHLVRASSILQSVLTSTLEGSNQTNTVMVKAALGHDLLEDTKATHTEIEEIFGAAGLDLIIALTNENGDSDHRAYIDRMAAASEEARLIKLADLFENYTSAQYGLDELGVDWLHDFFLPIVEPMRIGIDSSKFKKYPRTARRLIRMNDVASISIKNDARNIYGQ